MKLIKASFKNGKLKVTARVRKKDNIEGVNSSRLCFVIRKDRGALVIELANVDKTEATVKPEED